MARLTHKFKDYLRLSKEAFSVFRENHPVKFASAIAYFSLFALPSIFLIIVFVLSLFLDRAMVLQELAAQLSKVVGESGANILVVITANYLEQAAQSVLMGIAYAGVVFWLATQLFRLFQNSLNDLWQVSPDFDGLWRRLWVERGITFVLVLITGLLSFASVAVEWALGLLTSAVAGEPDMNPELRGAIVNGITALLVFLWFALLYKILPVVKIEWEPTLVGAAVTTVLFFIGIWLLWNFVVERDLEDLYSFVAPIILVALWVFYSSLVFLYGASFTKVYARFRGKRIAPAPHAYKFKSVRQEEFFRENK
jgi:membrane protein